MGGRRRGSTRAKTDGRCVSSKRRQRWREEEERGQQRTVDAFQVTNTNIPIYHYTNANANAISQSDHRQHSFAGVSATVLDVLGRRGEGEGAEGMDFSFLEYLCNTFCHISQNALVF